MKVENQVRVHECTSSLNADMAKTALAEAGIEATIQGEHSGQLLGDLVPTRFPILVRSEQAEEARDLLRSLELPDHAKTPSPEPRSITKARYGRIVRTIIGLPLFALAATAGLALSTIVVIAIADTVHATPHGHMIDIPVSFRYVVVAISLVLTFSRWAREKGLVVIVALTIALVAVSVRPRSTPTSTPEVSSSRPRFSPW